MISWGPSVRPLHETAEYGAESRSAVSDRGFGITLDGLVPVERDDQGLDAFDAADQDRFDA